MARPLLPNLTLTLGALALAGCGENPTQPRLAEELSAAASSLPLPSGTWTIRALMPDKYWRYGLAAEVVTTASGQSTVYVLGGRFNQAPKDPPATTILAYDATTDSWTTKAAHFTGAATNGAGRIGDELYISGGNRHLKRPPNHGSGVSSRLFAYNWRLDQVTRKANMPRATAEGITGVIDNKLYVLAGKCRHEELCRDFYRYDPTTNAWTTLPPAPNSHRHGAGAVVAGKFYVAGGGSAPFKGFDVYDPATNTWNTPGLLLLDRQFAVGTTVDGRFYVIGIQGAERSGDRAADRNTVAYDPQTNSWEIVTSYPGPVGEGGQFLLRPLAALPVLLDGRAHIFTLGSGHLYTDDTVKPAGTIDPAPPYIYAP
jgi:N-acetylneuraminic acid mutarotase